MAMPIAHRPVWRVRDHKFLTGHGPCGGADKLPTGRLRTGIGHFPETDIDPIRQQDGQEGAAIDRGAPFAQITEGICEPGGFIDCKHEIGDADAGHAAVNLCHECLGLIEDRAALPLQHEFTAC
ncbi:MAG: hypothetical protein AAGA32_13500 [Pseudomonadota bacterium]